MVALGLDLVNRRFKERLVKATNNENPDKILEYQQKIKDSEELILRFEQELNRIEVTYKIIDAEKNLEALKNQLFMEQNPPLNLDAEPETKEETSEETKEETSEVKAEEAPKKFYNFQKKKDKTVEEKPAEETKPEEGDDEDLEEGDDDQDDDDQDED